VWNEVVGDLHFRDLEPGQIGNVTNDIPCSYGMRIPYQFTALCKTSPKLTVKRGSRFGHEDNFKPPTSMPSARKRRKRAAAALPPPSGPNNALTFPAFWDLPSEYEINETDLSSTKPRKHWCFLGKIVSGGVFVRLSLEVEDKTGHRLLVAFHTNDRGAAFQHLCIPGHTIAVLHAKQHIFAFSPPGLRLEENAHIKVLPYSLDQVLKASKDLVDQGKGKRCEVCRMADVPLEEQCAGCKSVWYCSKASQTALAVFPYELNDTLRNVRQKGGEHTQRCAQSCGMYNGLRRKIGRVRPTRIRGVPHLGREVLTHLRRL